MEHDLEPLAPETAVEQYIESRKLDATQSTIRNLRYRLKRFLEWADETDFDDMNQMSGREAEHFKNWRVNNDGINAVTLEQHLRTFRLFIRWCESNDAVESGVADKIIIPQLSDEEKARDVHIEAEQAEEIIDYLSQFEYASMRHIIFHILWHTGMRRSSLHSLDVEDWYPDSGTLTVKNREGTPLKLGDNGERHINIVDADLVNALSDYIKKNRPDVEDEYGRKPLIATQHGRAHINTIQSHVYRVTRPCYYSNDCPHGEVIEDCEATSRDNFSKCPSSISPHPVRRGAITAHLNRDVPVEIASERMNVSIETLELHYDARSKEEKRKNRKSHLSNI
ncbi:tyrosine-type recombinase/integrase [Natrinema salsiterrestre]|uniref:Site-specific integrase n=1 Tax=Natrinema salsiterrestre TaxID=2950540 RepID=A0A9Q4KWW3_9EURY|nr:site-specific integrase [Natrinema salsiterrestre]MDF9744520.1 site-specific integrase [Natrinema salsiterrestre]